MFRLLLEPFIAVAQVLIVLGIFGLGFFSVVIGLNFLPGNPIFGWGLFIFGIGIWLCMIFRGINAMFGGPRRSDSRPR